MPQIVLPEMIAVLKLFFIGIRPPRRYAPPGYETVALTEESLTGRFILLHPNSYAKRHKEAAKKKQ